MRHQSRKEKAWTNVRLRGSQRFWFSSNWKQGISVLNCQNVLYLELRDLDVSETTFPGPCSSLKFSAIWLSDLIVHKDKGMSLRSSHEMDMLGPVQPCAMQELCNSYCWKEKAWKERKKEPFLATKQLFRLTSTGKKLKKKKKRFKNFILEILFQTHSPSKVYSRCCE